LEAQLAERPEAAVVTPRIAFRDRPDRLWYGGGDIDWRRASVFTPGFDGPVDAPEALRKRFVTFASGCALFMRRSVLITLGGFDPRFFMYEEDVELCLRAQKHGFRILYIPKTLILHRAQGSSNPDDGGNRADFWSVKNPRLAFYAFHIIRNRMLNIFTHANAWQKLTAAVFFPLYLLRHSIPFLLGGRPDAVLAMLRGIQDSLAYRKIVP
jgi:GT2 family glycosyltransferase